MRIDPSVYVAFDLVDSKAFLDSLKITQEQSISALIWCPQNAHKDWGEEEGRKRNSHLPLDIYIRIN